MDNAIYAALTRQSGLMNEMRAVANNMANSATTGFRREGVVFSEHLTAIGPGRETLSMANARGRDVDLTPASLSQTGGRLDLALEREGFFMVETPQGNRLTARRLHGLGRGRTGESRRLSGAGRRAGADRAAAGCA